MRVAEGLYYYGARYLDPKYSMWLSTDPALGEYIPGLDKDKNKNLPGMGGLFNPINANLFCTMGNNPVRYVDPDGREVAGVVIAWIEADIAVPEPSDGIFWKWLGYGVAAVCACAVDYFTVKSVEKAVSKSIETQNSNDYVYHSTSFQPFIDSLLNKGNSAIDKSKTNPNSRFGQQFYVASDPLTANSEAGAPGTLVKFKMDKKARILDLTNSGIAKKYGYSTGMSRDEVRKLMSRWDLSNIDAIKYPSEKNPGGKNYAVINPTILTPVGVE